ncbi:MAG: ATP-binding protein, partial [Armatimonadetes bacterium]|nr:ATP-binding protein [Armatimonadota bacterium]
MGDQPSPVITVGCERTAQGHRFFVQDNGVGIKGEDAERVFELFARGDGTRASGSGIGLAIVQRIVETHGGRVWVESRPGE